MFGCLCVFSRHFHSFSKVFMGATARTAAALVVVVVAAVAIVVFV